MFGWVHLNLVLEACDNQLCRRGDFMGVCLGNVADAPIGLLFAGANRAHICNFAAEALGFCLLRGIEGRYNAKIILTVRQFPELGAAAAVALDQLVRPAGAADTNPTAFAFVYAHRVNAAERDLWKLPMATAAARKIAPSGDTVSMNL